MKQKRLATAVLSAGILVISAATMMIIPVKATARESTMPSEKQIKQMSKEASHKDLTLETLYSKDVPVLSRAIDEAIRLLESGNQKAALAELQKAKNTTANIRNVLATHIKPKFANSRCPIMGSPINPERVADSLIREYKGQKIAFCCGGCPAQWDKLSDAQKQQKLAQSELNEK